MGAKFVVSHLDVQQGPFEESELKAKWVKGELLPIDYVYDDAKQDWLLVSERFAWATNKPEASSPPPLKDSLPRKARPPAPPKAIEISGASGGDGIGAGVAGGCGDSAEDNGSVETRGIVAIDEHVVLALGEVGAVDIIAGEAASRFVFEKF